MGSVGALSSGRAVGPVSAGQGRTRKMYVDTSTSDDAAMRAKGHGLRVAPQRPPYCVARLGHRSAMALRRATLSESRCGSNAAHLAERRQTLMDMQAANPLLAERSLPSFSAIRPEHVLPAIETILSDYRARIDALTGSGAPRDFESVVLEQERLEQRLNRAWAPVSHLHSVADSKELREAHSAALEKITDFTSELGQNRALYARIGRANGVPRSNTRCVISNWPAWRWRSPRARAFVKSPTS